MALLLRSSRQIVRQGRFLGGVLSSTASRGFAAEAAQPEEDDIVKQVFLREQQKFRAALDELKKIKIPLDPDNTSEVQEFLQATKEIRAKTNILSPLDRMAELSEEALEEAGTLRAFLEESQKIRKDIGVPGDDAVVAQALDAVEKELGRPVTPEDEEGLEKFVSSLAGHLQKTHGKTADEILDAFELEGARVEVRQMRDALHETLATVKKRDGIDVEVDWKEVTNFKDL